METFAPKGKVFGPILPQFVLERSMTFGAKIMYALLCNYASEKDHCWPSQKTLAAKLSCSVSSVKNYLAELVQENLVIVRRERYRSSVYYLRRPEELCSRETKVGREQPKVEPTEPESGSINTLNKQNKEQNHPLPRLRSEDLKAPPLAGCRSAGLGVSSMQNFEFAWEMYPKKEAKALARQAWNRLERDGQLPPLEKIQAAIERFSASESWCREQGRFVPQMANWLKGQRWLDPLSPAEEKEVLHRQELHHAQQAREEQEKRLQEQKSAERARVRPLFDTFAAKFSDPFNDAMVFGLWMHLRSRGLAPTAADVPANNCLGIINFINAFKRKGEEAISRAHHSTPQNSTACSRTGVPRSFETFLVQNPAFFGLFSRHEYSQQAV